MQKYFANSKKSITFARFFAVEWLDTRLNHTS